MTRDRFALVAFALVLAAMATMTGYAIATRPPGRPAPPCSMRIHEPAVTFSGGTVIAPKRGWHPCKAN